MTQKMVGSQHPFLAHNNAEQVVLRSRNKAGNRQIDRSSKVTSMIELFSNPNPEDANAQSSMRNPAIIKPVEKEVLTNSHDTQWKKDLQLNKKREGLSVAVRSPRPFRKESSEDDTVNSTTGHVISFNVRKNSANAMNMKSNERVAPEQSRRRTENVGLSKDIDRLREGRAASPKRNQETTSPKRISRALNYWEHKIEPPKSNATGNVPRYTFGQKQGGPKPFERTKFYPNSGQKVTPNTTRVRSNDKRERRDGKLDQVGVRPRMDTSALETVVRPVPPPKSINLQNAKRVPSSLHRSPQSLVKNRVNNMENGNTVNMSPSKKPEGSTVDKSSSNVAVNPLPKPERTFTFNAADAVVRPQVWNKNLIRVSSAASVVKGAGIADNVSTFLNRSSLPNAPKKTTGSSGYEDVVLFQTNPGSQTTDYNDNRLSRKWVRQHDYEDVEDPVGSSEHDLRLSNYDRINLDKWKRRPHSVADLKDGYSHIEFQQDLHTTRQVCEAWLVPSMDFLTLNH